MTTELLSTESVEVSLRRASEGPPRHRLPLQVPSSSSRRHEPHPDERAGRSGCRKSGTSHCDQDIPVYSASTGGHLKNPRSSVIERSTTLNEHKENVLGVA
ncbi:hypothetical protein AAG570_007562 [Ranatra chinensis]|uniref:Uncharacterized protein n=1 Tax=Ranatra chinensis TaxID=642074 RepID=A0ABD0Y986_9HEMI